MTVDSTSTSTTCTLESIPTVDLHLLSQSELYSLSLCSHSSSALNFSEDDVVILKNDCSVFIESAGSRKQTYSRLRLAPASSFSSTAIRHRTPHLRSSRPPPDTSTDNDPERAENSQIIHLLKELFAKENNNKKKKNDLLPINVDYSDSMPDSSNAKKRKRGRPRKDRSGEVLTLVKAELGFDVIDIFYNENVEDRDLDSIKDREIVNVGANGFVKVNYEK